MTTHGEQMYTIGPNASQTHVLFCDFFKQLIWKSFRNITEVCEIIKYRHTHEPCYISLTSLCLSKHLVAKTAYHDHVHVHQANQNKSEGGL